MDLKGIAWAGNIYEKFEAMCLEVEEVMYEDTVKYVENQVQKVGVSVKKFYSEIVQDLLPPSCVDPIKVSRQLHNHGNLTKKEIEGEHISNPTAQKSLLNDANCLSPSSPTVVVEYTCSDVGSTKNKKLGVHRRPIGIKRLSQNNCPSKITRPMTAATSSEFFVRRDPEEAVASKNKPTLPVSSDKTGPAESVRLEKDSSECASPDSGELLSAECSMQKNDDSTCTSSCHGLPTEAIGTSKNNISISDSESGFRSIGCEVESVGLDAVRPDEDIVGKNVLVSEISGNVGSGRCDSESGGEEVIVSYEDNFDMIENEEAGEPSEQAFEPVKKSNLEETCILVEGDELHSFSQGTQKHKSYKKKIREAFSSKLRSTRKQDQHVLDGNKTAESVSQALPRVDSDKRKLLTHDSLESDWELL